MNERILYLAGLLTEEEIHSSYSQLTEAKKKRKKKKHRKLTNPAPEGKKGSKSQYKLFKACASGWDGAPCASQSKGKWKKMTGKWEKEGVFKLKKK